MPAFRNCLRGVEQPAVGRVQARLGDRAGRGDAAGVVVEVHRAPALPARPVLQPHPGLGDHAEGALGAEEQPVGGGPGARAGQPAGLADPGRGDDAQRLDQVVDVGVEGGEVPAGPGGEPAAEGGELEGLREVAQGQAVRAQLVFQVRAEDAGLDAGGAAGRVDLEHAVEAGRGRG